MPSSDRDDTFGPATPTPCPAPPCRLRSPASHPRACQITLFFAWRQKAIWSSWSLLSVGCRSQGLPPGTPIKSHPPLALSLYPSPNLLPTPAPPQPWRLAPHHWDPATLSWQNNVGCQLVLVLGGKCHNFRRLKAHRFFILFCEPGVSLLVTNILILRPPLFLLVPNLVNMLGESLCKDTEPRTQHRSWWEVNSSLLGSHSPAGCRSCRGGGGGEGEKRDHHPSPGVRAPGITFAL